MSLPTPPPEVPPSDPPQPMPAVPQQGLPDRRDPVGPSADRATPAAGATVPGQHGHPPGYPQPPVNPAPVPAYPVTGHPGPGYPAQGYPVQGYPVQGYPVQGYPVPAQGYPPRGYPAPGQGHPPPGMTLDGRWLASFSQRLLAYLIDGLVVGVAVWIVLLPAFIVAFKSIPRDPADPDADVGAVLALFLAVECGALLFIVGATYLYTVELMFRTGQTIGKRAMRIRVEPLDQQERLTRQIAAKRWLAKDVGAMIIPGYTWLDGLWQLWDRPHQQCLHDKFARTVVVKVTS